MQKFEGFLSNSLRRFLLMPMACSFNSSYAPEIGARILHIVKGTWALVY